MQQINNLKMSLETLLPLDDPVVRASSNSLLLVLYAVTLGRTCN